MWFLILACSKQTAPPAPEPSMGLAELLSAHHTADLPGKAAIDANGGSEALWEIARTDEHLAVRARALSALHHYPGNNDGCFEVVDSGEHAKLRAAAIGCLDPAALSPDQRSTLLALLRDDDPRVALASATLLKQDPLASAALGEAATDPSVAEAVRGALTE